MRDNFFSNTTINSIIKRHIEKELSSFNKICLRDHEQKQSCRCFYYF
ncbi:hypothetical protein ERHA54_11660 [Erwinia rhapontici]|nr:hypothetical protein ERHA54_11660 [Erwinia rhapontici]